ncbi:HesA/MoeB/ThiF family protein [Chryseobacterium sp.]|uniref:HesA/MoeB/ThiF family protein n=1 Tax=Chryseobacterium sp. TaxID=1871047 RepID=UPI00289B0456|nr:HesA/MoeB/ThiF family protein [Chryseobacterium sp.]
MNERYTRHIQLEEIGLSGQQKLSEAKVLVIGAGGLGCPILQYLTTAGIGTLGIVDLDTVSLSNLHRQILFSQNDVGKNKAVVAKEKLLTLNPETRIDTFTFPFTEDNCLEIIKNYDIVVDGTDNFVTRYLINDACVMLNKPVVFGALYKFEGQVSVFNYKNGPNYRCLFPIPPSAGEIPNCNEIGVLGILPGIIGLIQANEVIKIILDLGEVLSGKILYLNTLNYQQRLVKFKKNEETFNAIRKKEKPEIVSTNDCLFVNSISLQNIKMDDDIVWIDVRELHETPEIYNDDVLKLPLKSFENKLEISDDNSKKIFFCQSGIRSQKAAQIAMNKGFQNCYSLKEGAKELREWLTGKK